ncbi:hypothetical protein [Nonomuraea rhodomycinica]|uniref:Uncharacterized protein n=1 Tax=Nonomuraea rhodomycinica TaxID=1712872 RepID=A0A7Y6INU5_9ACTN|nr:hypothetical protein [Nonomuraea rhodomycinica]NUW41305.1 hypothetical protein [Nonomuraea rhodomycinica]
MSIDLSAAAAFMATHARVLDRRRFTLLTGLLEGARGDAAPVLSALDAYRNADGGYGWGLEPDLRSPGSQPGAAMHAFTVFEDVAPVTDPRAAELCDWLLSVSLPDGGLPFALPATITAGTAPWWAGADPAVSSPQITAVTAAAAHRVAAHDPAVAAHPWLERATAYCLDATAAIERTPHAYELAFAVRLLDAAHAAHPARVAALLDRLRPYVPEDGVMRVEGGKEDERLRPLDFSPFPDGPSRSLFAKETIDADLDRLAAGQQEDGGWTVDYAHFSAASPLEWRGHATVQAVTVLHHNGRL